MKPPVPPVFRPRPVAVAAGAAPVRFVVEGKGGEGCQAVRGGWVLTHVIAVLAVALTLVVCGWQHGAINGRRDADAARAPGVSVMATGATDKASSAGHWSIDPRKAERGLATVGAVLYVTGTLLLGIYSLVLAVVSVVAICQGYAVKGILFAVLSLLEVAAAAGLVVLGFWVARSPIFF